MNLITASNMLASLEQSRADGPEDDAYFIIHRLLTAEVRKGNEPTAMEKARRLFLLATRDEVCVWLSDKVLAVKMYRERTGSGLYEAKKQLEDGSLRESISAQSTGEVTSCG
jgi:ribosomal protein L7/L12